MMALQEVQPGDLITAEFINSIITKLDNLEQRIEGLENSNGNQAPVITELIPTGPLRVGQELTIIGSNFGFLVGAHSVTFNNVSTQFFKGGSNDTRLILDIPNVSAVTEAGTPVTMVVSNQFDSTSRQVILRPAQVPQQGSISLTYQRTEPSTPAADSPFTFVYRLESQAFQMAT